MCEFYLLMIIWSRQKRWRRVSRPRASRYQMARDGAEALCIIATWVPDIILSDIDMPVLNGYELARRLRAEANTRQVVLIAVTARACPREVQKVLDAGFEYHVPKPAAPEQLPALVEQQISQPLAKHRHVPNERCSTLNDTADAENAVDN